MNETRVTMLIQQWLQDELSDAEFGELERHLKTDPAARTAFLRAANLDSALRDRAARDDHMRAWLAHQPARPSSTRKLFWPWGLAAAAAIAMGVFLIGGVRPRSLRPALEATAQGTAVLTQTIDAEWAARGPRRTVGATLPPGTFTLQKGLAQIEFFSGAALVVEAPAEFEIVSSWKVLWRHGKARVKVPPAARGFEINTPGMKVIDLGTEFGLDVDRASADARLQVFSGEIEAHPTTGRQLNLTQGQGIEQRGTSISPLGTVRPQDFPGLDHMRDLGRERAATQFARWQAASLAQRRDPRLIAYYPMQPDSTSQRLVRNLAEPGDALRDGGAVGAAWGTGRWPQKGALEFKGAGDRVRLQLDGEYQALTLACWVRVDGLDRRYNALLLTDGYDPGEPHWQIYENGRLMFSVTYEDPENPAQRRNQIYYSPVIFDRTNTGRWHHVAVTYDNRSGAAIQYVDGVEVSREVHRFHAPDRPVFFGPCELGNWGIPLTGHQFPIRNLNGRIDEFAIYSAVLGAEEVRAMYEAGRAE